MVMLVGSDVDAIHPKYRQETWLGLQATCIRCGAISEIDDPDDVSNVQTEMWTGRLVADAMCMQCGSVLRVVSSVIDPEYAHMERRVARQRAILDEQRRRYRFYNQVFMVAVLVVIGLIVLLAVIGG